MFARFGPAVPTLAAAAIAVVALLAGPGLVQRESEPAAERAAEPAAPAATAATAERIDATVASAVADRELSVAEFTEIRLQVASLQLQQATPVEEGRAALAAATRQLELLLPLSDGEQFERVTFLLAVLQNLTSPPVDPAGDAPADGDEAAIPAPVELPSGNAVGSDNASSSGNAVGNGNAVGSGNASSGNAVGSGNGNAGGNNGGSGSGKSGPKP